MLPSHRRLRSWNNIVNGNRCFRESMIAKLPEKFFYDFTWERFTEKLFSQPIWESSAPLCSVFRAMATFATGKFPRRAPFPRLQNERPSRTIVDYSCHVWGKLVWDWLHWIILRKSFRPHTPGVLLPGRQRRKPRERFISNFIHLLTKWNENICSADRISEKGEQHNLRRVRMTRIYLSSLKLKAYGSRWD